MNSTFLYPATLVVVGLLVLALVIYLTLIIIHLWRAGTKLKKLKERLDKVASDSHPLTDHVTNINNALEVFLQGMKSVNGHFARIVQKLK
jgi:uncharacterized membrane-anchored protein YhcB (DUF1043 family)